MKKLTPCFETQIKLLGECHVVTTAARVDVPENDEDVSKNDEDVSKKPGRRRKPFAFTLSTKCPKIQHHSSDELSLLPKQKPAT